MHDLRRSLSMVLLEQNAFQIELLERAYGVRVAVIADKGADQERGVRARSGVRAARRAGARKLFRLRSRIGSGREDPRSGQSAFARCRSAAAAGWPRQILYHAGNNHWMDTAGSSGVALAFRWSRDAHRRRLAV